MSEGDAVHAAAGAEAHWIMQKADSLCPDGTVSLLEVCESLAAPQANEKTAISNMFDRETKQEKNLEVRERDLKRAKLAEAEARSKEAADKKDGKDEKMEELLRKVDADFLAMIKEAEDDESKASEGVEADEK